MGKRMTTKHPVPADPEAPKERAAHTHHEAHEDIGAAGGALPHGVPAQPLEISDTQEALFAEDGAWDVCEAEPEGERFASVTDLQIAADGLTVVEGPPVEPLD